jgi:hypothetical protein
MQNLHEISNMQDTSTQAMTEVALGLSMAFFALLIIALMSVAMSNERAHVEAVSGVPSGKQENIDVSNQVSLSIEPKTDNKDRNPANNSQAGDQQTILLYWEGQFFDTQKRPISYNSLPENENIVVAVSPHISFTKLIDVQTKFIGKQMRLTTLDEKWQLAFSEQTSQVSQE